MSSVASQTFIKDEDPTVFNPPPKKKPYPFWLGGMWPCLGYMSNVVPEDVLLHRCRGDNRCLNHPVRVPRVSGMWCRTKGVMHYSPLDLTKVRLQATEDKRMIASMKKTVATGGASLFRKGPPVYCEGLVTSIILQWLN